ncbi:MAG TPA: GNAT family N-acetyltransferase [Solirubrobacteraceae bacterium]|nr:GNAT family N-acetyltransferase [Solirubrobacteraceae bacterium]
MSSFPRLPDPLTDGRVALRDYSERDIPEILIAYQDDRRLHLLNGEERPPSGAELGGRAEREPALRAAGERATLTVLEADSDTCRGQVRVIDADWDNGRAQLAIWVAPQARGRGLGTGALRLAGEWLLGACRLDRLELLAEPDNAPVIAAAGAAGFVSEGVLRGYERKRGKRVDMAVLSLIPADL